MMNKKGIKFPNNKKCSTLKEMEKELEKLLEQANKAYRKQIIHLKSF